MKVEKEEEEDIMLSFLCLLVTKKVSFRFKSQLLLDLSEFFTRTMIRLKN